MPKQVQNRRGTTAEHATFTGAAGEITVDTTKKTAVVHDGATAGGFPLALEASITGLTGRLVWVDQVNGNDATAARGKIGKPFLTLGAAKAAAISGDTIVVMPGTYNESNLAKNGVNWHFIVGAIVQRNAGASSAVGIFNTEATGAACAFKVTGHGVFKITGESPFSSCCVYSGYATDDILIEADWMQSPGPCVKAYGTVMVRALMMVGMWQYPVIHLPGGSANVLIEAWVVDSSYGGAVKVESGTLILKAHGIAAHGSVSGYAVDVSGGDTKIYADRIQSFQFHTVYINGADLMLWIEGARIECAEDCQAGRAVYFNVSPADPARACFKNCFFRCYMDSAGFAQAVTAAVLWNYGGLSANMAVGANVSTEGDILVNDAL